MFPRDARNTRRTSRSSLESTQNSHDGSGHLFDRDPDGAHRAVAVEGSSPRPDGHLAIAGTLDVFKRDLAHRGTRSDADTRTLVERHTYFSHLAADRAGAVVEAAL